MVAVAVPFEAPASAMPTVAPTQTRGPSGEAAVLLSEIKLVLYTLLAVELLALPLLLLVWRRERRSRAVASEG
jgi:hypothetical protein